MGLERKPGRLYLYPTQSIPLHITSRYFNSPTIKIASMFTQLLRKEVAVRTDKFHPSVDVRIFNYFFPLPLKRERGIF
jgi:hypothetical protein